MAALERHLQDAAALRFQYFLVPWDGAAFGVPVSQLEDFAWRGADAQAAQAAFSVYEAWRTRHQVALEMAKLKAHQLEALGFLEAQGFRWMETQYRMAWQLGSQVPALDPQLSVAPLRADDRELVMEIAARSFDTSRYAMDRAIGPGWAGRRYRAWLQSALEGGAQQVQVAHGPAGELIGFFVLEQTGERGYWHLTAVHPAQQGRGWGLRLWRHMMAWQVARGVTAIQTAISGHNLPVLGLYGRLGFRFEDAVVTLHRGGVPPAEGGHAA